MTDIKMLSDKQEQFDPENNFYNNDLLRNTSEYYDVNKASEKLSQCKQTDFSALHLNIRSMNRNFESFKQFILEININSS